ncbi:MAG: hypothetical protein ACOC6B_01355 [Thermodesulfobacteriota bacterium]
MEQSKSGIRQRVEIRIVLPKPLPVRDFIVNDGMRVDPMDDFARWRALHLIREQPDQA